MKGVERELENICSALGIITNTDSMKINNKSISEISSEFEKNLIEEFKSFSKIIADRGIKKAKIPASL